MKRAQLLSLDIQLILINIVHSDRWYLTFISRWRGLVCLAKVHNVLSEASHVQGDDATQLISLDRRPTIDIIMHFHSCHSAYTVKEKDV